MHRTILRN